MYSKETNYDPTFGGLRKGVWIGLSGYKTSEGNVRWKWQDEFPVMFTRWGLNQPNLDDVNLEPSKSCVYIDKGDQPSVSDPLKELCLFLFQDRNWFVNAGCDLQQSFVCKANFAPPQSRPRDDRGDYGPCPGDWQTSGSDGTGHYCLKAFSQEKSWFEADAICKANFGARLTSIHDNYFNDRVSF